MTLSITALGSVPTGTRLVRSGVVENDFLYISGTIGDSALGLGLRGTSAPDWGAKLAGDARAFLLERYLLPEPRLVLRAGGLSRRRPRRHSAGIADLIPINRCQPAVATQPSQGAPERIDLNLLVSNEESASRFNAGGRLTCGFRRLRRSPPWH